MPETNMKVDKKQNDTVPNDWKVDLGPVKMKAFRQWMGAVKSFDSDVMIGLMRGYIQSWPYDGDPSVDASYDDLELHQFTECSKKVSEAFGAAFQRSAG